MAKRFFEGSHHAAAYAIYRPTPPASLIEEIISKVPNKDLAVDVGCGSGQNTGMTHWPMSSLHLGIDSAVCLQFGKNDSCLFKICSHCDCISWTWVMCQNIGVFSPYFSKVVGIDISESQIYEAKQKYAANSNTEFKYIQYTLLYKLQVTTLSKEPKNLGNGCSVLVLRKLKNFFT